MYQRDFAATPPVPAPARRRGVVAALAAGVLVALLALASGCAPGCPSGQRTICSQVTPSECRCAAPCTTNDGCSGRDECLPFRVTGSTTMLCVDQLWLLGSAPPCNPICRGTERCVRFGGSTGDSCARACTRPLDCPSGCCVTLSDGVNRICAPTADFCANSCQPPCASDELCVAGLSPTPRCARRCQLDTECRDSCCLPLSGGEMVCSPMGTFCPTQPPPPCNVVTDCTQVQTSFVPAPAAACGAYGSYEGTVGNFCGGTIHCRVCWWSPAANAYADCANLPDLPTGATVPLDVTRCAAAAFPEPPARVRCVDDPTFRSGFDCLGTGPM